MACTTLLVGKKASYDGSTIVARNEDSPSGIFTPKKFIVVSSSEQPKVYKSVLSHVSIDLPSKAYSYTCMPNASKKEGIWGAAGVNEKNVSMSATETITSNERVLAADPLVEFKPGIGQKGDASYAPEVIGGIGEEDMVSLTLPYINSAREGVLWLGNLLTKYGTYEMNGIAFQDEDEIWWLETIGGHHWLAKRVKDEEYVVMPNQLGIDSFDLDDAYGKQQYHLCSSDLKEFIENNYLDLSLDGHFNPRDAFGSHSDADHVYNTPRAWIIERYFNPSLKWDGENAIYKTYSDNIPFSLVPEKKITIEDVKYVLSHHFQGTPYDPYGKYGDSSLRGCFRPIGINRNNVLVCVQIRPYMVEPLKALEWIAYGCNIFNAMIPFYTCISKTPTYLSNTTDCVTSDNFYWVNRLIAGLADSHFSECFSHIERYQEALQAGARALIVAGEKTINEITDYSIYAEKINQQIADLAQELSIDLLNKVLNEVSNLMLCSYSRSDA